MQYLLNASVYLIDAVFSFALYLMLLRFWMQWVRADFRNQLGGFIITVTNPVVIPTRKVIPSIGTIDTATLFLAYLIALLKAVSLVLLKSNVEISALFLWILVPAIGVVLQSSIYLLMAAIFVNIVASWVAPHSYHPILMVARSISDPIMAPARKLIPSIAGVDLSPILVFMFLNISLQLLVAPLLGPLRGFL